MVKFSIDYLKSKFEKFEINNTDTQIIQKHVTFDWV